MLSPVMHLVIPPPIAVLAPNPVTLPGPNPKANDPQAPPLPITLNPTIETPILPSTPTTPQPLTNIITFRKANTVDHLS